MNLPRPGYRYKIPLSDSPLSIPIFPEHCLFNCASFLSREDIAFAYNPCSPSPFLKTEVLNHEEHFRCVAAGTEHDEDVVIGRNYRFRGRGRIIVVFAGYTGNRE